MGNSIIEHQLDQDLFWEEEAIRCENPTYYIDNYCKDGQGLQIILRPSLRKALLKFGPIKYTKLP